MRIFRGLGEIPADFGPSAVTIGKFDGVHTGHRAVIDELKRVAAHEGLAAVAITFDRHPLSTLSPGSHPDTLVGVEQKLALLAESGLDATLLLAFDRALAGLSPEDFVQRILVDVLRAKSVLVGRDFRFGARGAGTVATLERLGAASGFSVRLIEDVRPEDNRRVSSSWIRELLVAGDVAHAARLLGRAPSVRGVVVAGAKRGRELGFPTANLSPESEGLIPADGVYAGWLTDAGVRYPAAISVGNNPTFDGVPQKQVEAYAIDEDLDLYGHVIEIAFAERIRGMVAFTGIDPLVAQMREDVVRAREILA